MMPTEESTPGDISTEIHALTKNHFCSEQLQGEIRFHTYRAPSCFFQGKNGSSGNFCEKYSYTGFTPLRNAQSIPLINYCCFVIACWYNPTVIFLPDILNQLLSYCSSILEQFVQVLANRLMFCVTKRLLGILSIKTSLFTTDQNKSSARLVWELAMSLTLYLSERITTLITSQCFFRVSASW